MRCLVGSNTTWNKIFRKLHSLKLTAKAPETGCIGILYSFLLGWTIFGVYVGLREGLKGPLKHPKKTQKSGETKHQRDGWWKKSCTSWYAVYPIINEVYIPRWCRICSINRMMIFRYLFSQETYKVELMKHTWGKPLHDMIQHFQYKSTLQWMNIAKIYHLKGSQGNM